jgi:uncharacterized protein
MSTDTPKRIVVTGATGTIGRQLVGALLARGDSVIALTRSPEAARVKLPDGVELHQWADPAREAPPAVALIGADAVINLLGEPISQRWSSAAKQRIHDSRVNSTRNLVQALAVAPADNRPQTLVSQSATGFYGPREAPAVDESAEPGSDWLSQVVVAWEGEALAAAGQLRVVVTRTGVVLAPDGGALEKMLPFFKAGIGGPVAGGDQWLPWIHLDDVVGGLIACVDNEQASGPVNLVGPSSATNSEFSKALGKALKRPAVLPVPGFALKALYGQMASIVTSGQPVTPAALTRLGYQFRYPDLDAALAAALS